MMRALLFWLSGFCRLRTIEHDGRPLFERYLLVRGKGWECFLHHYLRPDPARGLHNHPWAWMRVVVLAGWYVEEHTGGFRTVGTSAYAGAWRTYVARRYYFHAIRRLSPGGTWSLVLCGPRVGPWGYARGETIDYVADDGGRFDWGAAPRGRFAPRAAP